MVPHERRHPFFDHPILNSPYSYPVRHWELDDHGQPTQKIIEDRRAAEFITPIPKPKQRKGKQTSLVFDERLELSTAKQQYNHTADPNSHDKTVMQEVRRAKEKQRDNISGFIF